MNKEVILNKLLEIIDQNTPSIQITADQANKNLSELGYDSLDLSTFTLEVEEAFSVCISDEELEKLDTLNDFVQFLNAELN